MRAVDGFLLGATGLHAGFQVAVTALVYPAFRDVPDEDWAAHHARHSRRIVAIVAVVYALLLGAGAAVLLAGPTAPQWVALGASAAAVTLTATVAAPAHGRLSGGRRPEYLARLLVADRYRCLAAVVACVAAALGLR